MKEYSVKVNGEESKIREALSILNKLGYSAWAKEQTPEWFINRRAGWFHFGHENKKIEWDHKGVEPYREAITMDQLRTMTNQQQRLIGGAEAKLAWAKGEQVEYKGNIVNKWVILGNHNPLSVFDDEDFVFRIKPNTLTINIKIPAPFVPKEGEECCYLSDESIDGYHTVDYNSERYSNMAYGLYRPCDIKQVVAALRGALCQ